MTVKDMTVGDAPRALLKKLLDEPALSEAELSALFLALLDGQLTDAQVAAVLVTLKMRGETGLHVACAARAARARMKSVQLRRPGAVDLCGTGGDGASTFNISTAASLVVAACGVDVAKHGNRAVSSQCGSADVLTALGFGLEQGAEAVADSIERHRFGFMFAPHFHPSFGRVRAVRQELGVRTLFNLLGPLLNPASVKRQLIGVPNTRFLGVLSDAIKMLGTECTWLVHGAGLDELSPCGDMQVVEIKQQQVRSFDIRPEALGLKRRSFSELRGGSPEVNAQMIADIFGGQPGAPREAVLLNAAAALCIAEKADSLLEAFNLAASAIDSGSVRALVQSLRRAEVHMGRPTP